MKIKSLIIALFFIPMLFVSMNSNAQEEVPDWFYTTVNVPDFPSYCGDGWYAVIKITNTDFTSEYITCYDPTVVLSYQENEVTVATYPGEASVKFLCNIGEIYNGTVNASVLVYTPEGYPFCGKSGGVSGSFSCYYPATINLNGFWTYQ